MVESQRMRVAESSRGASSSYSMPDPLRSVDKWTHTLWTIAPLG